MKNRFLLFIVLFVISGSLFAQKANTKTLDKFTELKAYDRIVVTLVKSSENKLVITGDDKDEVNISNKNGLLKIKMEFDNFMDGDEAKATLYYTEDLALIDANENAKINSDEVLKQDGRIEIKTQEGGRIDLKVALSDLYTKSISGGEVTLSGSANTQEVMVNTGGKIYNKQLDTKETVVVVNAGGRADIKASDKVEAKVRAGGSIYIYGNPKEIQKDKVFGGKIKEMD
ncbi:head GIN domain-containing protein [Euzebyella saccharophila]|uniref:Head GIN domain-containing protein n=1 Tax=Euzebyella saccharophila TaxID=679664 RepID=A0ABV8JNB8_9FLAO|nr:head GIN domain-containing protein [Euzebyella saccharophila]